MVSAKLECIRSYLDSASKKNPPLLAVPTQLLLIQSSSSSSTFLFFLVILVLLSKTFTIPIVSIHLQEEPRLTPAPSSLQSQPLAEVLPNPLCLESLIVRHYLPTMRTTEATTYQFRIRRKLSPLNQSIFSNRGDDEEILL